MGLRFGLRGWFRAEQTLSIEPDPFPGLPGPAATKGQKSAEKYGAGFIMLRKVAALTTPRAGPRHGAETFNLERSNPGLHADFIQVCKVS